MSTCRVTILIDNAAAPGLASEHGLAVWIEAHGLRVLFDAGQTTACMDNARTLGVPVEAADAIVLSHGHYDHTGAMAHFLAHARAADAYLHPAATQPRFSVREQAVKDLRMPQETRAALAALPPARLHEVIAPWLLTDGIGLTGPIPRITPYEDPGGAFFLDATGARPDTIVDDQALWIHTPAGLVVCCGCCHAGLINTLTYIRAITGEPRLAAIIGGLHLRDASAHRMIATITAVRVFNPSRIIACHCTGELAIQTLDRALPGRVTSGYAGLTCAW